jgi:endo-1,4-beta-mannosidase
MFLHLCSGRPDKSDMQFVYWESEFYAHLKWSDMNSEGDNAKIYSPTELYGELIHRLLFDF